MPAWQKPITGDGSQLVCDLAVDSDGTIAVVGTYDGSVDLGGNVLTSKESGDVFVAAYSQGSNHKWSLSLGGPLLDDSPRVAIGPDGSVFVMFSFLDTIDLGGGPLKSAGSSDLAIAKFTFFGKFEWAIRLGGASMSPGLVAAFDTSGALVWAQQFGSVGEGVGESVDIAADESIVIGGEIAANDVSGSNPVVLTGARHPFVGVLEREGKPRWARVYSTSTFAATSAVAATPDEFVYHAGWFSGDLDLGAKTWSAKDADDGFLFRVAPP